MNEAIWEGSGHQLKIEAPFVNVSKAEVVRIGLELGVPYELTWSCYEGGENLAENAEHALTVQRHFRQTIWKIRH